MEKEIKIIKRIMAASVERLGAFLVNGAPDSIITNEIMLLFQLALTVYPTDMGRAFAAIISKATRAYYGICQTCDNDLESPLKESQCAVCRLKDHMEFGE